MHVMGGVCAISLPILICTCVNNILSQHERDQPLHLVLYIMYHHNLCKGIHTHTNKELPCEFFCNCSSAQ